MQFQLFCRVVIKAENFDIIMNEDIIENDSMADFNTKQNSKEMKNTVAAENFVIYCKSYHKDLKSFERLFMSYNRFNRDNIKFFLSIPAADFELFKKFDSDNVKVITDESFAGMYLETENHPKHPMGYVNQQICKLAFFETGYAKNYFCVDSDAQFIRDFYLKDFMADENTPYTVLIQDKELSCEKFYRRFTKTRSAYIKQIFKEIGLNDRRYRTCQGMQVLNSKVLRSFKEEYMTVKGYSYKDLIKISPLEFTWYNAWFQKCKIVPEMAVEPFFKTFHSRVEYIFARFRCIKFENYTKEYIGMVLNGNWKRPVKYYKNPNILHEIIYFVLKKIL